jgi:hypothetical protein
MWEPVLCSARRQAISLAIACRDSVIAALICICSLIEHASIEDYWQLALSTLFKQEQAAAFLQVRHSYARQTALS